MMIGSFKDKILEYLKNPKALPNFLLYSRTPGTGKTTLGMAIINELGCDYLLLNSSDDRNIETVREKIKDFAMTKGSKPELKRAIFCDEFDGMCLPYNAQVIVGSKKRPIIREIGDITRKRNIMIPSVNVNTGKIEDDEGIVVDSGIADFFEIELEDGRKIVASAQHPFFLKNFKEIKVKEMQPGMKIIDMDDDIFKKCPFCDKYIFNYKAVCSKDCQNKLHSLSMCGEGNPRYGIKISEHIKKAISKANKGKKEPEWKRKQHSDYMIKNNPMKISISRKKISDSLKGRKITWGNKISKSLDKHLGTVEYEKYCIEHNLPYSFKHQKLKRMRVVCQICGKVPNNDNDRHMHHINKNRKDNSDKNILDCCNRCHKYIHFGCKYNNYNNWKIQYFDKIVKFGIVLYGDKK